MKIYKTLSVIFLLFVITSCNHMTKKININNKPLLDAKTFLLQYADTVINEYKNNNKATIYLIDSLTYRENHNYSLAIKEVQKALNTSLKTIGKFNSKTAYFYKVLGDLHANNKDYLSAIKYYKELLLIFQKVGVKTLKLRKEIGYKYSNIAASFHRQKNYTKAIYFYQKSSEYFDKNEDKEIIDIYDYISTLYKKQNNHPKSIEYKKKLSILFMLNLEY